MKLGVALCPRGDILKLSMSKRAPKGATFEIYHSSLFSARVILLFVLTFAWIYSSLPIIRQGVILSESFFEKNSTYI
jgi:hypothetical protein